MTIPEQAVKAAEEAVYPRHERGFLIKPLIDPIDMRAALTAAAPYMSSSSRDQALDEVFQILQQYSEHPNEVVSFVMVELWDAIRSLKSKPAPL